MSKVWTKVRLNELLRQVWRDEKVDPSKTYRLLGARWYAQGLFTKYEKSGQEIRADRLYRVHEGDFVYNRLFAWKGSFAVAGVDDDQCYVSNEFPCFEVDTTRLAPDFLWHYFSNAHTWTEALGLSIGGTPTSRNRLNESRFLEIQIPLPPLVEQGRVVARIEELAGQIGEAGALRQHAAEETNYLARQIAANLFPPAADSRVGDYVTFQTGYAFKSDWFSDKGVRLARNANIGHGVLDWSETARIPEERRAEFSRFELQLGDILVALDRPIISTGVKVARVRDEDVPCLLLQRVARAQFQNSAVLPQYFFNWLRSPHFVNAIDPGRSNGVPHISHKDIEKIPFSPPTLVQQRRIVDELNELQNGIEAMTTMQAQIAEELAAILPAILDRAFKGELA
jgi:type I restriction enzyme S subunit